MELTAEQRKAHDSIMDWVKAPQIWLINGHKCATLGGYAGTGKTTLVGVLARALKAQGLKLAFCTVSGKASTVLKSKLGDCLTDFDYCGTIHSLIYRLIGKERMKNGRTELYFEANEGAKLPYDLIVVDEASMVNEWMFNDLAAHGIPILAVGDHGQLPPVKGSFNLMAQPVIRLETIMRQAEGNPIIQMALRARQEGCITYGEYGYDCVKTRDIKALHQHNFADQNSIMLCAMNKTRVRMNSFAREILKRNNPIPEKNIPIVGEPLICLYNHRAKSIYNGNIGILKSIKPEKADGGIDVYDVEIDMGDSLFQNHIDPLQFGKEYTSVDEKTDDLDFFDFAYCITTHKAQGSEWDNVLIMEEGDFMFKNEMWNRWLYTAVTRAKKRLVIFKR